MTSALQAALSGAQTTQTRQTVSAHNIANVNTPGFAAVTPQQVSLAPTGSAMSYLARNPNSNLTSSNTDLATEMVAQKTSSTTYSANLAVIKTEETMMGALLDLFA